MVQDALANSRPEVSALYAAGCALRSADRQVLGQQNHRRQGRIGAGKCGDRDRRLDPNRGLRDGPPGCDPA